MSDKVVVSPLSPSNFDVKSIYGNLDKNGIELSLIKKYIIPLNKIVISGERGKYAKYIISVNRYGQIFIIDIDVSGNTYLSDKDFIVKPSQNLNVSDSLKIGCLNSVGNDVDGIFFIYKKGIVIVHNDSDLDMVEVSYEFCKDVESRFEISNYPIPYVIIKLSELNDVRNDDEDILSRVYSCTYMLRVENLESCQKTMAETSEKLVDISENYKNVCEKMLNNITELGGNSDHLRLTVDGTDNKEEFINAFNTLSNMDDQVIMLIETMNAFDKFTPMINNILSGIEKLKKEISDIMNIKHKIIKDVLEKYMQ